MRVFENFMRLRQAGKGRIMKRKALMLFAAALAVFALASCADIFEKSETGGHRFSIDLTNVLSKESGIRSASIRDDATVRAVLIDVNVSSPQSITEKILNSKEEDLFLELQLLLDERTPSIPNRDFPAIIAGFDGKAFNGKIGFDGLPIGKTVVCAVFVQRKIGENPGTASYPIYEYSYGKTDPLTLKAGANGGKITMPALEPIFVVGGTTEGGNGTRYDPIKLDECSNVIIRRMIDEPSSVRIISVGTASTAMNWNIGVRSAGVLNDFGDGCTRLALVGIQGDFKMNGMTVGGGANLIIKNAEIKNGSPIKIQAGGTLRIYNDGKVSGGGPAPTASNNSVSFEKGVLIEGTSPSPIVLERYGAHNKGDFIKLFSDPIADVSASDYEYYKSNPIVKNTVSWLSGSYIYDNPNEPRSMLSALFTFNNATSGYRIKGDGTLGAN